jgi:hypothetical protein
VAASSTRRRSFLPMVDNTGKVYVANIAESTDQLTGVMYTRFNFTKELVEEVHYHILSKDLQEKIKASSTKGRFHLINFTITPQGNFLVELQKKNIEATGYTYNPYAVNDLLQWQPRKTLVTSGEKLLFEFDSSGKLVSEKFNP